MDEKSTKDIDVVYVSGCPRSGTTILAMVLQECNSFFLAGELRHFWKRGLQKNRHCACGVQFNECEIWGPVRKRILSSSTINGIELKKLSDELMSYTSVPMLLEPRLRTARYQEKMEQFLSILKNLYEIIQDESSSDVIIDTSHLPFYGFLLSKVEGLNIRVIQMVRDGRAVAHSWQKKKEDPSIPDENQYLDRHHPIYTILAWKFLNGGSWLLRQTVKEKAIIHHEDFVEKPSQSIKSILENIGFELDENPFVTEREVEIGINHTFSANPVRFERGNVKIRNTDKWRTDMNWLTRKVVTFLGIPLLYYYDYL